MVIEGAEPRRDGIDTACLTVIFCVWEEDILTLGVMRILQIQMKDQTFFFFFFSMEGGTANFLGIPRCLWGGFADSRREALLR